MLAEHTSVFAQSALAPLDLHAEQTWLELPSLLKLSASTLSKSLNDRWQVHQLGSTCRVVRYPLSKLRLDAMWPAGVAGVQRTFSQPGTGPLPHAAPARGLAVSFDQCRA